MRGVVFDVKRYSVHDGPGIRTTVFLKGCPLSCAWCHNPESQAREAELVFWSDRCVGCGTCEAVCPESAIAVSSDGVTTDPALCRRCGRCAAACPAEARQMVGRTMTPHEVMEVVLRDRLYFDESGGGVSFSGGEPLMQRAFLMELLRLFRGEDVHSVVDTSGLAPAAAILEMAEWADLILYDLKIMDTDRHRRFTGVGNEAILSNLELLMSTGALVEIRVPVIPGINDDDENFRRMDAFLTTLPRRPRVALLPYHRGARGKHERFGRVFALGDLAGPSAERLSELVAGLSGMGYDVQGGG